MGFQNRREAGQKLAAALASYANAQAVVLALPRGGVPVAAEIATALRAALDLVLVRKIGVPQQPELAMGAVVDGGRPLIVRNDDVIALAGIDQAEFEAVCRSELAEIERRRQRYLGSRRPIDVADRVAIVVDDGIATGATTRAALRATRMRNPRRLVLAVPVAPTESLAAMREEADEVVCLEDYESFGAIGYYYADFRQVSDQEVIDILARFPQPSPRQRRRIGTAGDAGNLGGRERNHLERGIVAIDDVEIVKIPARSPEDDGSPAAARPAIGFRHRYILRCRRFGSG
jgi:predicted phosphoribosyltransferase